MILTIRIFQICGCTEGDGECAVQSTRIIGAPDPIVSTFVRFLGVSFLAKFVQRAENQFINRMLVSSNVIQLLCS